MTKQFDKKSKIRISFFVPFFNTYYKTVLRTLDRYDLFFARVNLPILIVKKGVIITLKFRILPIPKSKHTHTLLFHTISNCIELKHWNFWPFLEWKDFFIRGSNILRCQNFATVKQRNNIFNLDLPSAAGGKTIQNKIHVFCDDFYGIHFNLLGGLNTF